MKTIFARNFSIFLGVLMVLGLLNFTAWAKNIGSIQTTGQAKIWIDPDSARIFLGVETVAPTVKEARQVNAQKIKQVLEAIKALNIKNMLIKAPSYNVYLVKEPERYATKELRLPVVLGYQIRQEFTILLKSDDPLILSKNASQVIDAALENGVNIITNVNFFKEDDSQYRRSALQLAVKDAISNAKIIAEATGLSVDDYTTVSSSMQYWFPPNFDYTQMHQAYSPSAASGTPTTLLAGQISITCSVSLNCTTR